jgi:hypothetical protein
MTAAATAWSVNAAGNAMAGRFTVGWPGAITQSG